MSVPEIMDFVLKKTSPGCTGMFWRGGTHGQVSMADSNWPRDDAILRGKVVEAEDGSKWLHCTELKQKGENEFKKVADDNCWMPFKYSQYYLERVTWPSE